MELNPAPFRGPVVYGLDVNTGEGVRTATFVNGIQVDESRVGEIGMANLAIHHDLQPGINTVELRIATPGGGFDEAPREVSGTPPANAFATLVLEGDEVSRAGDEIRVTTHIFARDKWVGRDASPLTLPHRLGITFEPNAGFVAAPWSEGLRVADADVANMVYNETSRVVALLRDGDLDAYMNATAVRRTHMARSYPAGDSADAMRRKDIEYLASLRAEPGFRVTMRPFPQAVFRAQADRRLFDWIAKDGGAIATIGSDKTEEAPLTYQFSMMAGRLSLVR